ncbi:putative metal ion transporter [Halteromyces radiatus]|uniref:putative metal ion transporter n=1 Tax=Halteromyces radiatus TaxID=101107 RepID=UPI002220C3F5|nr:putative metal ion transporter [Halteromyces radiatus]KAI8096393.1 putative metal ion transporter [Halteromyces radiatus]
MGFGRPSNTESTSGAPPLLGSFPLDHEGECKQYMQEYIKCLRANKNNNGACRPLSKAYLQCRMDKGLMDKDDMKNLGFADIESSDQPSSS